MLLNIEYKVFEIPVTLQGRTLFSSNTRSIRTYSRNTTWQTRLNQKELVIFRVPDENVEVASEGMEGRILFTSTTGECSVFTLLRRDQAVVMLFVCFVTVNWLVLLEASSVSSSWTMSCPDASQAHCKTVNNTCFRAHCYRRAIIVAVKYFAWPTFNWYFTLGH